MAISINDLREELLRKWQGNPLSTGPLIEELKQNTDRGKLIDPAVEAESTFATWLQIYAVLLQHKLTLQASEVALAWYGWLCELQARNNTRYHKGGAVHNAGVCSFMLGDYTRSAWLYACAFVEDVMNLGTLSIDIPKTPATQNLYVHFGWTEAEFISLAATARAVLKEGGNLWWSPEATLVRHAREGKLRASSLQGGNDIQINVPLLSKLIGNLPNGTKAEKKAALEFLASYVLLTLSSVRIKANIKAFEQAATFEHEIDVVAIQYGSVPTYLLEAFGRQFLVECKNWDSPVGVGALNHFVAKMRFHRCNCGVIFSSEGLSGDGIQQTGLGYARITQLRWYQQDNCVVVVISKTDLDELLLKPEPFSQVLLRGYESVRFSSASGG